MSYENLILQIDGAVATVTVNRPKTLNALNIATVRELHDCFQSLGDNDAVGAIIMTGAGEKSFVSGADIQEIRELDVISGKEFADRGNKLYSRIEKFQIPVIAAVNGYALGGGCELAMACHLRVAAENAKFGQPEINLGIIPGYGGTQRLPRLIGRGKALELLLTGRVIPASEALNIGLVNSVVPQADLMTVVRKLAEELAAKPRRAAAAILNAVENGLQLGLDMGLRVEESWFAYCCGTEDKNEGTAAFLEKRKAVFTGR
ncbi:enoyl-CoA hydratase/isomerase family protein [candidate division KSB1 bacterium]|nr:enoyl-CoA hydratase/isomerase family protein [candidate division KSB1 bacterium]